MDACDHAIFKDWNDGHELANLYNIEVNAYCRFEFIVFVADHLLSFALMLNITCAPSLHRQVFKYRVGPNQGTTHSYHPTV